MEDLREIKILRKKLGLTQRELAKRSGVSQSLIAKIESNKVEPSYSVVKNIFKTLRSLERGKEKKAKDVMKKKMISVDIKSDLKNVIKKMRKYAISQLPVFKGKNIVGMVTESDVLDSIISRKEKTLLDIMEEPPPIISKESTLSLVTSMLKHYPIVLVSEKGKIIGIITKSDVIEHMV